MILQEAADLLSAAAEEASDLTYADYHDILLEATDLSPGAAEHEAYFLRLSRPANVHLVAAVLNAAAASEDIEPPLERALNRLAQRLLDESD